MRHTLVVALAAALALLAGAAARAQSVTSLYYQEVQKDGQVYVFNTPERFASFQASGQMGTNVTLVGRAEGGMNLVGENATAVDLYLFRHNLPAYDRPTPQPQAESKYPATKIQGRFYGDFSSKQNKDDGTGVESSDSGVGVDVKRFYFTVTHQIDDVWSAQFQSDIGDQGTKRYDVFVKKAFLQGKFSDALVLRLGSADTPWVPFVEGQYGMRYLENTLPDSLGFGTSADWGIHLLGKLGKGLVDYQVSAVNGKGYSSPARTKSADFEGRIAFNPMHGLTLAVGGYSGKLGNDTKSASPAKHTAQRLDGLANFSSGRFGIGGEYFQATNWKNVTTDATDKADGFSIWAHFDAAKAARIFARYDSAKPSKDLHPDRKLTYYNLGVEHTFNKAFTGSIAYKYADVKGGTVGTSNGTIGSTVAGAKGKYTEIGVFAVYNF
jgi:hypothetical protein